MKLGVGGIFVALGLLVSPDASAAGERILVAGLPDDPLANTILRELDAMGFATVRGGAASGCSPATVEEMAHAERAIAATCAAGNTVVVWSISGKFVRLEDILYAPPDDSRGPQSVAVRVAEVARASVSLTGDPDALPAEADGAQRPDGERGAQPAPNQNDTGPLHTDNPYATPADERPRERARPPHHVIVGAGAGAAYLHGSGADMGSLDLATSLRIGRWVAPYARLLVPIEGDAHTVGAGVNTKTTSLSVGMFLLGAAVPLLAPTSRIDVRAGLGVGVAWMQTLTVPTGSAIATAMNASVPVANTVKRSTEVAVSAASISAGVRVVGPLVAAVDCMAGTTASAMQVVTSGTRIAAWQTFVAASVRAEAVFQ